MPELSSAPGVVGALTPPGHPGGRLNPRTTSGTVPTRVVSFGAVTSGQVTGLQPGNTYKVRIRAFDAAGNRSDWSNEVVVVTTADTTRTVSVGGATTGSVTGLTPSSAYTAQVRARDAAGNWSAWSTPAVGFTTAGVGVTQPTVTPGRPRPVIRSGTVGLDVVATPPGAETITAHSWVILSGGGSLTNATTATPTYTAPGSGSGLVVVRDTVTASGGGTASAEVTVSYHANVVAAENALTGTARGTWDLSSPNLGGVSTLQGFADGFTANRGTTINFKIAQSDTAGWNAEVYRLGYYNGDGARLYATLTPNGTQVTNSQAQPSPGDADPDTTLLAADCAAWATTLTWTPPAWAPSGIYLLKLNRTGGGTSHVLFIVREDARAADLMLMPADSTWNAYNAWGGMGANMYAGNSLYYGTAINQYNSDAAHYVSYNRPVVNRGAADSGRSYGAVAWSTFFTGEYPMVRFAERNGIDVKYYGCIDAAADPTGTFLAGNGSTRAAVKAGMFVGHNEYWSDGMRAGWETAKAAGVNVFSCAGNEVFWRLVGTATDSESRPRTWECQKSTIGGRGNTRPQWTGTWRDPDGAGKGGNNPENTFTGTIFCVNGPDLRALVVPFAGGYSAQPLWRNTTVAALTTGQTYTSPAQILGFEWDTYGPAGVSTTAASYMAAPHARARYCSTATYSVSSGLLLTDAGDEYLSAGTATHRLVVQPGGNGSFSFGTGTINWALGCDSANTYQQGSDNTDVVIQQATINVLTDMGAPARTPMSGVTVPSPVTWFADAAAGLTVTATLTTAAARTAAPAAALTATATLTAGPARVALPDTALSVTAALTTSAARTAPAAAALAAVATLTTAAGLTKPAAAALTVTAALAADTAGGTSSAAALAVTATLTTAATVDGGSTAALTVTATLGAGAARTALPALTLTAAATLTAGATIGAAPVIAAGALTITATLTTAGVRDPAPGAGLTITATLTTTTARTAAAAAALTITATITAGGTKVAPLGAALSVLAVLVAAATATPPGIPFADIEIGRPRVVTLDSGLRAGFTVRE